MWVSLVYLQWSSPETKEVPISGALHQLPLHHYILEQAKLLGYRLDLLEDGSSNSASDESDEDWDARPQDDEEDFADDEAMSHQESSSSQEGLAAAHLYDQAYHPGRRFSGAPLALNCLVLQACRSQVAAC